MEPNELDFIKGYCVRLNDNHGNLDTLTKDERRHFALLLRKYELEQTLDKLAEDLSQIKML